MGLLSNIFNRAKGEFSKYQGDTAFLAAACAAAALVINADGVIEDSEINSAVAGLTSNELLTAAYTPSLIEEELTKAINHSKTRAGKMTLNRSIEAVIARPPEQRQDVFLIAADVGDSGTGGLADEEKNVLIGIGKLLNLDANKLLAA